MVFSKILFIQWSLDPQGDASHFVFKRHFQEGLHLGKLEMDPKQDRWFFRPYLFARTSIRVNVYAKINRTQKIKRDEMSDEHVVCLDLFIVLRIGFPWDENHHEKTTTA